MYEKLERLVNENKLTFACSHTINEKHYLKHNKEKFLEVIESNVLLSRNEMTPVFQNVYCFDCGEYVDYFLKGEQLVPDTTACFSRSEVVIEIPVPTGELIFTDYPKYGLEVIKHLDNRRLDINSLKGTVQRTLDYAAAGIAHFFVGNSSPHVFNKDGVLTLGRNSYDEEDCEVELVEGAVDEGYVCTDLWWVTAFDRQTFEQIAKTKFGEEKGSQMTKEAVKQADLVLHVEPGTYKLRYFTSVSDDRELHATLEKI